MSNQVFNPILENSQYQNGRFPKIPIIEPGTEVIMYNSITGGVLSLSQKENLKPRDISKGKYDRKIVVDMRMKTISIAKEVQSKNMGADFSLEIKARAQVKDAVLAWKNGCQDISLMLWEELEDEIRRCAQYYEIREVLGVQNSLRNLARDIYLDNIGIQISGIDFRVNLEERYREIFRTESYERERSSSAQKIEQFYMDGSAAVFADVVSGKITPAEARERAKRNELADFKEAIERGREQMKFIEEIREKDLLDNHEARERVREVLRELTNKNNEQYSPHDMIIQTGIEVQNEEKENDLIYRPFDEEE